MPDTQLAPGKESLRKLDGPSNNDLKARRDKRGFPLSDRLYQKVAAAYDAARRLFIDLHYMSCTSGVGLSPRKSE